ncbi:MAG: FtsX-like permease family protein [Gammaproteobacteria bacterium]|nr:FtsX-like permease family protein [Gammaproteobacteria bacterium]
MFADPPENVTQCFEALLPFELVETYEPDYLENFNTRFILSPNTTYLYVANDFDPASMEAASRYLYRTYMADEEGLQRTIGEASPVQFTAQKLSDIHFDQSLLMEESTGNIVNMYIFAAVAIALLVISCINYVNIATARAAVRMKEVAMRRILGASGQNLVLQFLSESVLFITLAFVVGILLSMLIIQLGYVEDFTGKTDLVSLILTPGRLLLFIIGGLAVGALSGVYPAYNLARQLMMEVFRPQQKSWRTGVPLRQLLVLVQMIASVAIVPCVLIMLQQSNFLVETPLGFKKEDQLIARIRRVDAIRSREAIMTEFMRHTEILSVVEMGGTIGRSLSVSILPVEQNDGETEEVTINNFSAGVGFLDTLEIELLQGNMFRADQVGSDNPVVLVNETFVEQMEWDQAIGKRVGRSEVIGAIQNFHYLPLHEPIAPVFIQPYIDDYLDELTGNRVEMVSLDFTVSVTGNDPVGTREYIEQIIRQFSNQSIVEIFTLTETWTEMYDDENQTIFLISIFSGICIVISLLGLGGLAAFTTQQRARETAIRKVLGASVPSVITLLSLNMVKMIGLAVIPAVIGAYYLSSLWLERFSYRVDPSGIPYLQAIVIVAVFSISVLVLQTYRTAQANPVEKLKYE